MRKTWVQTYGFLCNTNCLKTCKIQKNTSVDPNIETIDTIINRNPNRDDNTMNIRISDNELKKFDIFKATHGPTMV